MSKACSVCLHEKPATAFYKAAKAKTGLSNRCKECDLAYQRARKAEKATAHKRWYAAHGESQNSARRERNKNARIVYLEARIAKMQVAELWRKQHAARALQKRKATPFWVDAAHHARIAQIYAAAQSLQELTATVYHVDHIVPLFSENVCGLHVWWNLQPLPESHNLSKNNVFNVLIYPEQGAVAFPFYNGLTSAQIAVHEERVEKANE